MTNIIFLDIDGVLNTEAHLRRQKQTGNISNRNWSPIACRHISLLCKQFDARIVVSSTWRYSHTTDELREIFADNNIDPELVIGVTPDLMQEKQPQLFCRGDEIRLWLEENEYHTYVIIDDLPVSEFLKDQEPHFVLVKQDKGFAVKEAAVRAGEILSGG